MSHGPAPAGQAPTVALHGDGLTLEDLLRVAREKAREHYDAEVDRA